MTTFTDMFEHQPDVVARSRGAARTARRQVADLLTAALYRTGWLVAKVFAIALLTVSFVFYLVGWLASKAVWPTLVWIATAVRLGWDDARGPDHARVAG